MSTTMLAVMPRRRTRLGSARSRTHSPAADQIVAAEIDPIAVQAAVLAQRHTLRDLRERARKLDAVLADQPPSVADQLTESRRARALLADRRALMVESDPAWRPSRRRVAARTLASIDGSIAHADGRVEDLEGLQNQHDAFTADHADEFAELKMVNQAFAVRRLTLAVEAVAEPPLAIVELFGTRPAVQRERLRWDRAARASGCTSMRSASPFRSTRRRSPS